MLLSVQQRFILDALKKLGCLRREQLLLLTRGRFQRQDFTLSDARMDAMLRQLRHCVAEFRWEGELVKLGSVVPKPERLEAINIMLELTGGVPLDFNARLKSPLLLQFTWGSSERETRPFTVALLPALDGVGLNLLQQYRRARVIWLPGIAGMPEGLALPPKHFCAVQIENGSHRFYGYNGR